MNLTVENLEPRAKNMAAMALFEKAVDEVDLHYLRNRGFLDLRVKAVGCIGWIWSQWLLRSPASEVRRCVEATVNRGMEMQDKPAKFEERPRHELYLLHCAIFGCSTGLLKKLAERVVDSSGHEGQKPVEAVGELYASAWCGMLKHWILGNKQKAADEAEIVWGAYRDSSFRAANKHLVAPWLKGDWDAFVKAQSKDFNALWKRGRRDGIVKSETPDAVVVDIKRYSIEQLWCWAHCGLALLAHRQGIKVATDPFWFPEHALTVVGPDC